MAVSHSYSDTLIQLSLWPISIPVIVVIIPTEKHVASDRCRVSIVIQTTTTAVNSYINETIPLKTFKSAFLVEGLMV